MLRTSILGASAHHRLIAARRPRVAGAHLHPAPPQHPVSGLRQPRIEVGQQPGSGVQQHPADRLAGQAGHSSGQPGGQQLDLRGDLGAGVTRADHHEGAPRRPLVGIGGHLGQLERAGDVVAQVDRFGDAAEPVRVRGSVGIGSSLFTLPAVRISRS